MPIHRIEKKLGFGLVRDSNGNPKFDGDPNNAHPAILNLLTPPERQALGVWEGEFARDAQGTKRLTKTGPKSYEAVDALVAVSEIFDGTKVYQLSQRVDVPAGGTLEVEM